MIWILIVGLIVGAIAKLLMPGKDPGGIVITMFLGVLGAMLAHFIGVGVGWYRTGEAVGIVSSVVGAIIILGIYRAVTNRHGGTMTHP